MQKITPFLWFDGRAGEAMDFYTSIFKNSKIVNVSRYGKGAPGDMEGSVMTCTINLDGQDFMLLNAGPMFTFTPAISLFVTYDTVEEIDELFETLCESEQVLMPLSPTPVNEKLGSVRDKYVVSWQLKLAEK